MNEIESRLLPPTTITSNQLHGHDDDAPSSLECEEDLDLDLDFDGWSEEGGMGEGDIGEAWAGCESVGERRVRRRHPEEQDVAANNNNNNNDREDDYDEDDYDEDDDDDDDAWSPLPFAAVGVGFHGLGRGDHHGHDQGDRVDSSLFGFARDVVRSWAGASGSGSGSGSAGWAPRCLPSRPPSPPLMVAAAAAAAAADDDDDGRPPGMVPASSEGDDSDPSEASSSDSDETMSASSSGSCAALLTLLPPLLLPVGRGVTFNEQVRVLPIPPIEDYTPEQRYRMYANRFELRENKTRNKREYEFDGHDWRNATEEHAMAICPLSGELLHPAHL